LTRFELPDPTNSDILTNSIVRMVISPQGRPVSFTLLSSSGLSSADDSALRFARSLRFEPLPGSETEPDWSASTLRQLIWGTLLFGWHAQPPPPTNAPPPK
jgi:TonB family protein